jgi:hypothetical protein
MPIDTGFAQRLCSRADATALFGLNQTGESK